MNIHHNNLENYFGIFTIGALSKDGKNFSIEKATTDLGTRIGKLILFVLGNVVSLILYLVLLAMRANLEQSISNSHRIYNNQTRLTNVSAANTDAHNALILGYEANTAYSYRCSFL